MNPAAGSNYSYPYDSAGPPPDRLSKFVLPAVIVLVLLLLGGGYLLFFQGITSQSQAEDSAQISPTSLPPREYMMMGADTTTAPTPTIAILETTPTPIIETPVIEVPTEIPVTP